MRRLLLLTIVAGLLLASAADASISLVQSKSVSCSAATNCTITLSSNTTSGNLLIFGLNWGNTAGTITACDGGSCSTTCPTSTDTWSTIPSNPVADGASSNEINVTYTKATTALTSLTYCVSGGGSHTMRMGVFEYSSTTGWQSSPLDVSATSSNSSNTSAGSGTITPAASGELVFAAMQWAVAVSAITVSGTGMTEQPTSNGTAGTGWISAGRIDGCDNENSGNVSTTCTFSWTTAAASSGTIGAFKPASSNTKPAGQFPRQQ